MIKKYFLIFMLFIFSFNTTAGNIEHDCHEKMKMEITIKMEENHNCDCCEEEKEDSLPNCECNDCEFSQSFYIAQNLNIVDFNYKDSEIDNFTEYIPLIIYNKYKPPIFS